MNEPFEAVSELPDRTWGPNCRVLDQEMIKVQTDPESHAWIAYVGSDVDEGQNVQQSTFSELLPTASDCLVIVHFFHTIAWPWPTRKFSDRTLIDGRVNVSKEVDHFKPKEPLGEAEHISGSVLYVIRLSAMEHGCASLSSVDLGGWVIVKDSSVSPGSPHPGKIGAERDKDD